MILSVGNLVARKGHDMVIRALPGLLESIPEVVYLIVGDGPHRQELENLACATGVREHVIFAGQISDERLPETYALCDAFVMPSRERLELCDVEGFGMVFLEASACGKPVVAGRSGGIGDAVVDGMTGLLVNSLDTNDIGGALRKLLGHRDLAIQLGRQGRTRLLSVCAWTRIADRVQGILRSLVLRFVFHWHNDWKMLAPPIIAVLASLVPAMICRAFLAGITSQLISGAIFLAGCGAAWLHDLIPP